MTYESLNRRLALLPAVFVFFDVALGAFALTLNYWSYKDPDNELPNDTNTNDTQSNIYGWKNNQSSIITPLLIFVGCVLMTVGLTDYGSIYLLNYYCSRAMMAAIIFACAAVPISAFVAGQYSALEQRVVISNETHDVQKYSITNDNGL
ncbi:unnamed protein product [Rotaria magnacalcarata]|uniref:Uncharacterized protein n=1 Tax=Rotaria magnacalcarata TaxID=392030 RepID=A0A818ZL82_9BILA|nr:unnamed protein product [Rotaria magnacalcarata]CAF1610085.1 unnamed protein product [Rotaria magnacalcarata]CAF2104558.1 unnamed protein product [Rotaria magnacalcarata]CAF2135047.1 unnamed protein product [Rotaria magnacalcarata]CAF2151374.1 unnamed protein product [Rotaria magnacalcarata]